MAAMKRTTLIVVLLGLLVLLCHAANASADSSEVAGGPKWAKLRLHRRNAVKAVAEINQPTNTNEDTDTRKLLDAFVDGVFSEVEKLAKATSDAASTLKDKIEEIGSSVGKTASEMHESTTKMIEYKPAKVDEKLAVAVPLPAHEVEVPSKEEASEEADNSMFDDWMPTFSFCDEGCFDCDDDDVLILVLTAAFFFIPFGAAFLAAYIHKKRMQRAGYVNVGEVAVFGAASSPVWTESDVKLPPALV